MKLLLKLKIRVHRKVPNLILNQTMLRLKTLIKRRKISNLKNNQNKKKKPKKKHLKQREDLRKGQQQHNQRKI